MYLYSDQIDDAELHLHTFLYEFLACCGAKNPKTLERGRIHAACDHVLEIGINRKGRISAKVSGNRSSPYRTQLLCFDEGITLGGECLCPVGYDCEHSCAVALVLLWHYVQTEGEICVNEKTLLPREWIDSERAPSAKIAPELKDILFANAKDTDVPSQQSGKDKGAAEKKWWENYLEAPNDEKRREVISAMLRKQIPNFFFWMADKVSTTMERYGNPLDQLEHFQESLRKVGVWYAFKVPPTDPALESFLSSDACKEQRKQYAIIQAQNTLLNWLESSRDLRLTAPENSLDVVWEQQNLPDGASVLYFEALLTSKRLERSPRNPHSLQQIINEVKEGKQGKRKFPIHQMPMLHWLADLPDIQNAHYSSYNKDRQDTKIPVSNIPLWLNTWAGSGMVCWKSSNQPVGLIHEPASLNISPSPESGELCWTVETQTQNPESPTLSQPLHKVELITEFISAYKTYDHRSLYILEGNDLRKVNSRNLPCSLVLLMRKYSTIPLDLLRKQGLGEELLRNLTTYNGNGQSSQPNHQFLCQHVPVDLEIQLVLEKKKLFLCVATRATEKDKTAEEQMVFWRLIDGTWSVKVPGERTPQPVPDDETALQEITQEQTQEEQENAASTHEAAENEHTPPALALLPRPEDIAPIEEWFCNSPLQTKATATDEGNPAAELNINRNQIIDLIKWWETRPPRVKYLGNRAFLDMITLRQIPHFSTKIEPSGVNWLQVSFEMESEMDALSLSEVEQALSEDQSSLVMLPGGRVYRREELEKYQREIGWLDDLGLDPGSNQPQKLHALHLAGENAKNALESAHNNKLLEEIATRGRDLLEKFKGIPRAKPIAAVKKVLRSYQTEGVDFLAWATNEFGGAVLADDMGLGKTLQVLATLTALRKEVKKSNRKPSLVICPASVANNWKREAQHFTPSLKVHIIESGQGRHEHFDLLPNYDIVVTNYALARRDSQRLQEIEWDMICIDEAQAIKNPAAAISQAVKTLPANYRIALTGTPIENRITDLISIVDFAVPGYLPNMKHKFDGKNSSGASDYRRLRAQLRPILIRRLKGEVAPDLPERIEERIDCEMEPKQRKAYLAEVKKTRLLLAGMDGPNAGQKRFQMLAALTRLRQICCDPALARLGDLGSGKTKELIPRLHDLLDGGHKVLVFSQFVTMLGRIEGELDKENIRHWRLTGQMGLPKRQEAIDDFQSSPEPGVFLISLKAGGAGLNLTAASHVVLFDPWWNPAVEAQAIDRTHRIGQDKTVLAFRLVTKGTIEERILELQESKRSLVKNVLEENAFNKTLSKDDFAFLLAEE